MCCRATNRSRVVSSVLLLLLTTGVGCGRTAAPTFPSAKVAGSVTLDGKPIAEGTLQFIPGEGSKGQTASGQIRDGKYSAENVPIGKLKVLPNAVKKTGKLLTEYSQPEEEVINIIPAKYQAGIDIEITGDNPALNFELKSDE